MHVSSYLVPLQTDPSDDTADAVSSVTSSLSGSSAKASGFGMMEGPMGLGRVAVPVQGRKGGK